MKSKRPGTIPLRISAWIGKEIEERELIILTSKEGEVRFDSTQERAIPATQNQERREWRSIEWSVVLQLKKDLEDREQWPFDL
jgi:hypothetical protein